MKELARRRGARCCFIYILLLVKSGQAARKETAAIEDRTGYIIPAIPRGGGTCVMGAIWGEHCGWSGGRGSKRERARAFIVIPTGR